MTANHTTNGENDMCLTEDLLKEDLLTEQKARLRKTQSAQRKALKENDPMAAQKLAGQAKALIAWATDQNLFPVASDKQGADRLIVAGYWPIRTEIDPLPLMAALMAADSRIETCLPATPKPETPLIFHRWQTGDTLIDGLYGTSEPSPDAQVVIPHLILAPLLAFDQSYYRLGYGGGFYDRTLAAIRHNGAQNVMAVGMAYAGQQVAVVPVGAYDAALNAILTEQGFII